jgi:UDP-glucose-4-epimerase GalE
MRVLVTGGAGYIGSHTVRHLLERGHDVVAYDNLEMGHREFVPAGRLVVGDLLEADRLDHALLAHRAEAVIHFAALAAVGESVRDPNRYWRINVTGSLNLVEACRRHGVRRLVFSSTCATYGIPEKPGPITEDTPQRPINPYGRTKLAVEQILADAAAAYGLGYAALRYFNAAGARPDATLGEEHDPETHLIPLAIFAALGRRPALQVFGDDYPTPDGTCIRDYVHVDDLADAHLRALERIEPGQGSFFNLGTGRGHSVREVIAAVEAVSGRRVPHSVGPRRPGDPASLVASAARAREVLGWQPRYADLRETVSTAWKWHTRKA